MRQENFHDPTIQLFYNYIDTIMNFVLPTCTKLWVFMMISPTWCIHVVPVMM